MPHVSTRLTLSILALASAIGMSARIPQRAIVVTGDTSLIHDGMVAVLYNNPEFQYHDPSEPRFLFLDRQGKIALGIGGYVFASAAYDFNGEIDNSQFITYDVPVPANPAMRSGMHFDVSHSTIFLQLAGHSDRIGTYSAYVQTDFAGAGGVGLRLRQACFKVGAVTAGLTRSTFVDPSGPPSLDTQGPGAQLSRKNILVRYIPRVGTHWQFSVAAESPASATYTTTDSLQQRITQRIPDFVTYAQYSWTPGSYIRLSALLRNLSYRDLVSATNRYCTGWAVQLSGTAKLIPTLTAYYEAYYGRGIATYINDLDGRGLDLIPSATTPGHMTAPGTLGFTAALKWQFHPRVFASATFSQARMYHQNQLGADAYRRTTYAGANVMWTIFPECAVGMEYLHGYRRNNSGQHATANRLMAAIKYTF